MAQSRQRQVDDKDEAREEARKRTKAIKAGLDPEGAPTFDKVAAEWLTRHVDEKGLRSADEIRRFIKRHLLPAWSGRDFELVRRGDVAALLDRVQEKSGARSADYVLAIISKMANWYATRNENYVSPIIRGMRRHSPKEHARERILSDDEIRELWAKDGEYGNFTKLLLLTGQRCAKVNGMRFDDIKDGVWTIPQEAREKGTGGTLRLPDVALSIIESQPRFVSSPYVFVCRRHLNPRGKDWVLHDLRRTAKSLMSWAGVQPNISERVLGHAIDGVEGIYDRHSYREEKAHALKALAGLIENILRPQAPNVVSLRQ